MVNMRLTKCCCCIPIKVGAYIIGGLHVFGMLAGLYLMSAVQISLEMFCGISFLYMLYKDTQQNRMLYFSSYCVYAAFLFAIRAVFVFWKADEHEMVRQICHGIERDLELEKREWSSTDYKDARDCRRTIGHEVARDEMIGLLITLLI